MYGITVAVPLYLATVIPPTHGSDSLRRSLSVYKIDAPIATLLYLGIIDPLHSGTGGVIHERPRNGRSWDLAMLVSRETAPLSAKSDMYNLDNPAAQLPVCYLM